MAVTLAEYRNFYAEEIAAAAGLRSKLLVDAFAKVPREDFFEPGPWKVSAPDFGMPGAATYRETEDAEPKRLYHNILIAIDPARRLNNGHPSALAAWLDVLELAPGNRVFHVGAGVGYYTAIMAEVVGSEGHVTGVEVDPSIAARAKTKMLRTRVQSETAVISARTDQTRSVRDELVGARTDLADTRQQKLVDLSTLSTQDRADAEEIDALQAASQALAARIRAAQSPPAPGTDQTPSSAGLIWPVQGPVTSPFGWRWGRMHEGIDIGVPYGTPIHAAASGTIIYCGWEEGYGNLTVIDHGNTLATAYGHQSSIAVSCGQQVTQGQVIGYVGSTGHSTGPHLHFEVRVNGAPVDPMGYL